MNETGPAIAAIYSFASRSRPRDPPYMTMAFTDGTVSCNCPGMTLSRLRHTKVCWHVRAVRDGNTQLASAVQTLGQVRPAGQPIAGRSLVNMQLARRVFALEDS